jgi:hypothetical protein
MLPEMENCSNRCLRVHIYIWCIYYETLGLSMELINDDILVQTTSRQTIARIKRVEPRLPQK